MFKERFLTQLMNNPIGGDPAWCFNVALKYKKSTGQYCRAFFKLCLRRMIYFHEVETRPVVSECMGVYVNWAEYVEAPVVDAQTEHSKMLPMRNLAELMILEDVLTRKILFNRELATLAEESPTFQTMLTQIEVSQLVGQAAAGVEHAYGSDISGNTITSSLRDAMDSDEDEEPLDDQRIEKKLRAKQAALRNRRKWK